MYTLEQLKEKSLPELKDIGLQLNALPDGDRRLRRNWIRAIEAAEQEADVNDEVNDEINDEVNEQPASQEQIAQAIEKSLDVEVDPVQEPIENSPGVEVEPVQEAIAQAVEISPGVEVDPVQELKFQVGSKVKSTSMVWGIQEELLIGTIIRVQRSGVRVDFGAGGTFDFSHSQLGDMIVEQNEIRRDIGRDESAQLHNPRLHPAQPDGDSSSIEAEALGSQKGDRILAVARDRKTDRGRLLPDQSHELIANFTEADRPQNRGDKGRDWLDSQAKVSQKVIALATKYSPCVEADSVFEPIESKFGRIVYPRPAAKVELETSQSAIAQVAEHSVCIEVDRLQLPFIEMVENSPAASVEQVQEPIAPAVEKSPGVDCVYCHSPEYESLRDESYKCYKCQPETDLNPILTGIVLSERFLARYSPPQPENIHYHADADGQLSLLDFDVESIDEPPDPDDFDSMFAFWAAYDAWAESNDDNEVSFENNPEISLDSFCEWAPCPDDWYEPAALLEPSEVLEVTSAIESSSTSEFLIPVFDAWYDHPDTDDWHESAVLLEPSEVLEVTSAIESSSTSEFLIPVFGAWRDLPIDTDEPPDIGIFARLPNKPKPPGFPPIAILAGDRANHIRKFARGATLLSGRSPPGGDVM